MFKNVPDLPRRKRDADKVQRLVHTCGTWMQPAGLCLTGSHPPRLHLSPCLPSRPVSIVTNTPVSLKQTHAVKLCGYKPPVNHGLCSKISVWVDKFTSELSHYPQMPTLVDLNPIWFISQKVIFDFL